MKPKSRILGGWHYSYPRSRRKPANERHLFKVSVPTSIDSWDDWVLACNLKEVERWIAAAYPGPHCPGYEITITQLDCGLDTVYLIP